MEVTTNTPERHYLETHETAQRWLTATTRETQSAREAADNRLRDLDRNRCADPTHLMAAGW
jgi:hypothetical protein